MDTNELPVDRAKVQTITSFLSHYMLGLPEYNTDKTAAEAEIMELDNLSQQEIMTAKDRDRHNGILRNLQVPEDMLL